MTNKTRRTEITIETHEITIIRGRGKQTTAFCRWCQSDVTAFRPEEIAALLQLNASEIDALAMTGEIHFVETFEGNLPLVCGGSHNQKINLDGEKNNSD